MFKLQPIHLATLLVLAGALLAGRVGQQIVDLSAFPLERLPRQLGPWECTSEERLVGKETEESRCIKRHYRNNEGVRIVVILQATASRLGALRDWTIGRMGTGSNVERLGVWRSGPIARLPFEMTASEQWLYYRGAKQFTLIWFVSPDDQAATFKGAQVRGWRDRVLGHCMWGELYLETMAGDSEEQLIGATRDLAVRLAPHFYELVRARAAAQKPTSPHATDGTT